MSNMRRREFITLLGGAAPGLSWRRAAADDDGDWVSHPGSPKHTQNSLPDSAKGLVKLAMSPAATWRSIPLGVRRKWSATGIGGRFNKPESDHHRGTGWRSRGPCCQSRDRDGADRVRDWE